MFRNIIVALVALLFSVNAANAGEKWDMALAYGAGNFHSANATEFAKSAFPLFLLMILAVIFIIVFPEIALWLPQQMIQNIN